jgi:hypothetical protein
MTWAVDFHPDFEPELEALDEDTRDEILAYAEALEELGPQLKRPRADTLKGSDYGNMKELRLSLVDGEWRVAYAFDPERKAILLVAGNKSGVSQKVFYKRLIKTADTRYASHLKSLRGE